jgi:hypothetical protein
MNAILMQNLARLIAHFPAAHLGAPNLLIFFTEVEDSILKTDIEIVSCDIQQAAGVCRSSGP